MSEINISSSSIFNKSSEYSFAENKESIESYLKEIVEKIEKNNQNDKFCIDKSIEIKNNNHCKFVEGTILRKDNLEETLKVIINSNLYDIEHYVYSNFIEYAKLSVDESCETYINDIDIVIKLKQIECLYSGIWLDDVIINGFLKTMVKSNPNLFDTESSPTRSLHNAEPFNIACNVFSDITTVLLELSPVVGTATPLRTCKPQTASSMRNAM
jgi:hypothetical protein